MSGETLHEDFEFRVRLDAMRAKDCAVKAIADTWQFMTGEAMPDSVEDDARATATEHHEGRSLWAERLTYEATANSRLSAYAISLLSGDPDRGDPDTLIHSAEQLQMPENNPFITELICKLGEAILDSAYLALGPSVHDVIAECRVILASSMSDSEKIVEILERLDVLMGGLLNGIDGDTDNVFKDENGRSINHILRLSPYNLSKCNLGDLEPTCLAVSIIMASYLKQCGVDSLFHVGVITPKDWPYAAYTTEIAGYIDDYASSHPVPYPDNVRQMIKSRLQSAARLADDWDPHSAVLFGIGKELVLSDPVQRTNLFLTSEQSEHLQAISDLQLQRPALEVTHTPDNELHHLEWATAAFGGYLHMLEHGLPFPRRWDSALNFATQSGDIEPILQLLDTISSDSSGSFASHIKSSGIVSNRLQIQDFTKENDDVGGLIDRVRTFAISESEAFIRDSLARQVFWLDNFNEELIRKCLDRCKTDEEYFRRRSEDLVLWPQRMMLAGIQRAWSDIGDNKVPLPHLALEVGSPAHRIGACALLDVSYGLGEELPISFWARQSSSQLPWLYSAQSKGCLEESTTGQEVFLKLQSALAVSNWRYRQIAGIV